jgi:hypothetical protein
VNPVLQNPSSIAGEFQPVERRGLAAEARRVEDAGGVFPPFDAGVHHAGVAGFLLLQVQVRAGDPTEGDEPEEGPDRARGRVTSAPAIHSENSTDGHIIRGTEESVAPPVVPVDAGVPGPPGESAGARGNSSDDASADIPAAASPGSPPIMHNFQHNNGALSTVFPHIYKH